MGGAAVGELGAAGVVGVLDEVHRLGDATGAEVERHHRLGLRSDLPQEGHELAQAEAVGLGGPPGDVEPARPALDRADAVLPAVAGDEVASGVADRGDPQLADELQDVGAQTVLVGGRVAGLVDARVDAAPEVLDEGAEEAGVDGADGEVGVEGETSGAGGAFGVGHADPSRSSCSKYRPTVVCPNENVGGDRARQWRLSPGPAAPPGRRGGSRSGPAGRRSRPANGRRPSPGHPA